MRLQRMSYVPHGLKPNPKTMAVSARPEGLLHHFVWLEVKIGKPAEITSYNYSHGASSLPEWLIRMHPFESGDLSQQLKRNREAVVKL